MNSSHIHDQEPQELTEEAHLFGGPLDGVTESIPFDVQEVTYPLVCAPDPKAPHVVFATAHAATYVYCPHATARLGRQTFRYVGIAADLCAC